MIRRRLMSLIVLFAAGCSHTEPAPPTTFSGRPMAEPTPPASQPAALKEERVVPDSTQQVASIASDVFKGMGLPAMWGGGDVFSSVVSTETSQGRTVRIRSTWRKKGETAVVVESTLTPDQHAYFMEQLRAAFAAARTAADDNKPVAP